MVEEDEIDSESEAVGDPGHSSRDNETVRDAPGDTARRKSAVFASRSTMNTFRRASTSPILNQEYPRWQAILTYVFERKCLNMPLMEMVSTNAISNPYHSHCHDTHCRNSPYRTLLIFHRKMGGKGKLH